MVVVVVVVQVRARTTVVDKPLNSNQTRSNQGCTSQTGSTNSHTFNLNRLV